LVYFVEKFELSTPMDTPSAPLTPLFTNDAVVLGILMGILALIFYTSASSHPFWKKFYRYVPSILLCYFIPSLFNSFGIISGDQSVLYTVASQYLLPASLVYFTLSIDYKAIARLGPKALIMFLTGTLGIMIGGPLALLIVSWFLPEVLGGSGPEAVWRGLSTIAGSWIGGGANQTALKEVFQPSDRLFSAVIAVDVICANLWMAILLYGAGRAKELDARMKANSRDIEVVRQKIEEFSLRIARIPSLTDLIILTAAGFCSMGLSHALADVIAPWITVHAPQLERLSLTSKFFWVVVMATTLGMLLSLTPARKLEGVGASKIGSLLLYILVATIGMKMDTMSIFDNPSLFLIGFIWISIHGVLLLIVARIIKAPFFFTAVGSQANVGGAASAPIIAAAFHPALAPVGVLMAVLGYALGTYCGYLTALLMQIVAEGV
jgi:uncharacterized membrane protein